jgi:hypothetical protein
MAESYSSRIRTYCAAHGIEIPPGFARHPASRYAVIDLGGAPPRLVARTWFSQEDLVYHLRQRADLPTLRLLDFKDRQELRFDGSRLQGSGTTF